jgi:hypothetical protein
MVSIECQITLEIVRCFTTTIPLTVSLLMSRRFHTNLPLLHFLADRKAFLSPTPLLLASILYISALNRNMPESAAQAPEYFSATCSAIAELVAPLPSPSPEVPSAATQDSKTHAAAPAAQEEERVFNDILGLIMASLSSEAFVDTTGIWIAVGYRLLLDHCPHQVQDDGHDWRGLFSGLQVCLRKDETMEVAQPLTNGLRSRSSTLSTPASISAIRFCRSNRLRCRCRNWIADRTMRIGTLRK